MKAFPIIAFFALGYLSSASVGAEDSLTSNEVSTAVRIPYQITVTPNVTRGGLRKLIINVEDDFVERFNELNVDDDYDIMCRKFAPTMSHIGKRVCEPNFFIEARADNASESMFLMFQGYPIFLLSDRALRKETARDFEILQEKVDELTRTNADLRGRGFVLTDLRNRLKNLGKED